MYGAISYVNMDDLSILCALFYTVIVCADGFLRSYLHGVLGGSQDCTYKPKPPRWGARWERWSRTEASTCQTLTSPSGWWNSPIHQTLRNVWLIFTFTGVRCNGRILTHTFSSRWKSLLTSTVVDMEEVGSSVRRRARFSPLTVFSPRGQSVKWRLAFGVWWFDVEY